MMLKIDLKLLIYFIHYDALNASKVGTIKVMMVRNVFENESKTFQRRMRQCPHP